MIVDLLKSIYDKKKILNERGAWGGRKRAKRKGRLVAIKVVNKKGYTQTVYVRPDRNKKGGIRTRSKHINPNDVKFKDIVTGYIDSYERMLYRDYKTKYDPVTGKRVTTRPSFYRNGREFVGWHSGITDKVNQLIKRYGLPTDGKNIQQIRKRLFEILGDDRNLNRFIGDARSVHRNLMTLENRRNIRNLIGRNFSYIDKSINKKKQRGALATTLRNIREGKQAAQYGIYNNRDRLALYQYYKADGRTDVLKPVKYTKKTIQELRKNPYFSKFNSIARNINSRSRAKKTQARAILSKYYIPKSLTVRMGSRVLHTIHPMYVRIYGQRALRRRRR